MKKKILTGVLSTSIVIGGVTPVFANPAEVKTSNDQISVAALEQAIKNAKISKDEAINIAKNAIEIPKGYTQENISFDSYWRNNIEVWRIEWIKMDKGHSQISVMIDADSGEIVGHYMYNDMYGEQASFPPKIKMDEAINIAKENIKKLYPDKLDKVALDKSMMDQVNTRPFGETKQYFVRFYEMKNGIPFQENSISFSISGNGDILNSDYNWVNNVNFEENKDVLSEEEVMNQLKKETDMELRFLYNYYDRKNNKSEAKLAYVPKTTIFEFYGNEIGIIDAKTGKKLNYDGSVINENDNLVSDTPVSNDATPLPERKVELSKEEAYKIVSSYNLTPSNVKLEGASYYENYRGMNDGFNIWSFRFVKDGNGPFMDISIEINAKTGELINYQNSEFMYGAKIGQNVKAKVTKEEAKKVAIDSVKKLAGDKANKLYLANIREELYDNNKEPGFYNFYFVRKENGIPVEGQGVNVTISTETGEVGHFRSEWNKLVFPSTKDIISKEEAKDIFIKNLNLNKSYFTPQTGRDQLANKNAKIVYRPTLDKEGTVYLDAKTGKWINRETSKPVGEGTKASDIEGHWAEKTILAMIDHGLLDVNDGKINPDKEFTNAESIKLLLRSLGYSGDYYYGANGKSPFKDISVDDEIFPYIQWAISIGLIDASQEYFYPNASINREDFAVLIVKSLGYDKLAKTNGVFEPNFKDNASIKAKGHVALIQKLGIMQGATDGNFNPQKSLTKAEAIVTISKFLDKKANLNERR